MSFSSRNPSPRIFGAYRQRKLLASCGAWNLCSMTPRPPGSEKLSGRELYRIRQGVYRIIYEVVDEVLIVTAVKVGHRKRVYKNR